MSLGTDTIAKLFPANTPNFSAPFYAERDKGGEVHIWDSDDQLLLSFCRYTQMPLDDTDALEAEVDYWLAEAERIVAALNASYPKTN